MSDAALPARGTHAVRVVLPAHLRKLARGREVDPEVESMSDLAPGPSTVVGRTREQRLLLEGLPEGTGPQRIVIA